MKESDEEEWEFDDRRFALCSTALIAGEELVWYEKDERFRGLVRKTLRRLKDGVTFLVEDPTTRVVLTVGTLPLPKAE